MPITIVPARIVTRNGQNYRYRTQDGEEFVEIEEAVEHENKITEKITPDVVYEQIWSIQEAINKAVATGEVVRFLWQESNKDIRKSITDIKGCKLLKPDKDSKDIAILPPGIETFDFFEVK